MTLKLLKSALIILTSLIIVSCCKDPNGHDPVPPDPPNPTDPTEMTVEMKLILKGIDLTPFTIAKSADNEHNIRYIIDIYLEDGIKKSTTPIKRLVQTKSDLSGGEINLKIDLELKKYTLLFWVDYVKKNTDTDLHYNTTSLMAIKIAENYIGNSDTKDAFCGVETIDLTPYIGQNEVTINKEISLKRPFAKYQITATDLKKYIDLQVTTPENRLMPTKVVCKYLPSIAEQYNVLTQKPERYVDSKTFTAAVSSSDNTSLLAHDYLFIGPDNTNVAMSIDIFDQNNTLINTIKDITIPIKLNALTQVNGEYLTKVIGSGGIGVDDNFDDEIIITIPD